MVRVCHEPDFRNYRRPLEAREIVLFARHKKIDPTEIHRSTVKTYTSVTVCIVDGWRRRTADYSSFRTVAKIEEILNRSSAVCLKMHSMARKSYTFRTTVRENYRRKNTTVRSEETTDEERNFSEESRRNIDVSRRPGDEAKQRVKRVVAGTKRESDQETMMATTRSGERFLRRLYGSGTC